MDKYFIVQDTQAGFLDFPYELLKGDPERQGRLTAVHIDYFFTLFFAKRKARKLAKVKNRYINVWSSNEDE